MAASELAQSPHTRVPLIVISEHRVSYGAQILLGLMGLRAHDNGLCYTSQDDLAKVMGCSIPAIKRFMAELRDAGYLESTRRFGETSKHRVTLSGIRCDPNVGSDSIPTPDQVRSHVGSITIPTSDRSRAEIRNKESNTLESKPKSSLPFPVSMETPEYDRLVAAYPRNITQTEFQVWLSVVPESQRETFYTNLALWKESPAWTDSGGRFIPSLSKFLDGLWKQRPKGQDGLCGLVGFD